MNILPSTLFFSFLDNFLIFKKNCTGGLPKDQRVKIKVYDLSGREMTILKDERINAGYYANAFNLNRLCNGIY